MCMLFERAKLWAVLTNNSDERMGQIYNYILVELNQTVWRIIMIFV